MNPLIGKQLELIEEIIQDLGTALERRRFAERRQTQERERLLQEQWRGQKQVSTLKRITEDYDEVEAENERLRQTHKDLRERLQTVLAHAKALSAEFHP